MAFEEVMLSSNIMEMDVEENCTLHEFGLHDPLSIDMKTACQNLLSEINQQGFLSSSVITKEQYGCLNSYIINDNNYETKSASKLLNCISNLLLNPSLTLIIANLFRPILIDL